MMLGREIMLLKLRLGLGRGKREKMLLKLRLGRGNLGGKQGLIILEAK
jgi:hypothetical protein